MAEDIIKAFIATLMVISLIIATFSLVVWLYGVTSIQNITSGKVFILGKSSYKCKVVNTLEEK